VLLLKEDPNADESSNSGSPLRVLIADDHPLVLMGVRRSLEDCEDIEIVGEARCAEEVLALAERRNPNVLLTDLRMPGANGGGLIASMRERFPDVKVVVLSACDDAGAIEEASEAGACAFVVKSVKPIDLASVVRQAASGVLSHVAKPRPAAATGEPEDTGPGLTGRELTILKMVAAGHTSKAISSELWLSEHTVKFHLTNIYRKLGVRNRSGAVRYAIEYGLVDAVA
jgi:DNA-binding NarL/FixJ family response regulator